MYVASTPDTIVNESNGRPSNDPTVEYWVAIITSTRNLDSENQPKNCTIERRGIPIEGADGLAQITDVWLEMSGDAPTGVGTPLGSFRVGVQEVKDGPVQWTPYFQADPRVTVHLDPNITGRFVCWEVQSQVDAKWILSALTFNWERAGER